MTGDNCRGHIATEIAGRAPVLCRRWVPSFALVCPECGGDAPGVKLARFCANVARRAGNGGDVAKAIAKSAHRRAGA